MCIELEKKAADIFHLSDIFNKLNEVNVNLLGKDVPY